MSFVSQLESKNLEAKYQKPDEFKNKTVAYGTAGFRTKASDLDWVMYRMGFLACLRSISQECKYIGCMITASHNPEEDNGCKLIDPLGDMLEEKWEHYATQLVNSNDLKATLVSLCQNELKSCIDAYDQEPVGKLGRSRRPTILIAHDTRVSCAALVEAFKTGVELAEGLLVNYGLLSTPQLHYMVRCLNTSNAYGEPNEAGYFAKVARAFVNVWSLIQFNNNGRYETELYVDGANGVGAGKIRLLSEALSAAFGANQQNDATALRLCLNLFNDAATADDKLNHLCGADFVKVQQKPPRNLPVTADNNNDTVRKYCSLDGDADRIVYYYVDGGKFVLLDGDKISTLFATHLKELVEDAGLADQLNLCIVQTAYANGSSTNYIENVMKVKASCVPTGVKHLHHEAQNYDVSVYFEANGHGTVLFSDKAEKLIEDNYALSFNSSLSTATPHELVRQTANNKESKQLLALYNLKHVKDCINQTVGDALTDMLVVELVLAARQLSVREWASLYTDLPCRQLKVTIEDRTLISTHDAERRVAQPAALQLAIDELVARLNEQQNGRFRSFVRPSGTEDVVRVYAEGDTQASADSLAHQVAQLVYDLAGGVGPRP